MTGSPRTFDDLHGFTRKDQPLLLRRDTGLLLDFLLCGDDLGIR